MNLTEVNPIVWQSLAWALGLAVRIVWPYLMSGSKTERSFDWRYTVGQFVGAAVGYILTIGTAEFIESVGALSLISAFAFGYGGASFGRNSQKTVNTIRSK